MKTRNEKDLEERLRVAMEFNTDAYRAMEDLLPEATIHVRSDVDTVRIVRSGNRYSIEFGQAFLEENLQAPQDLAFAFLHEIYHHVLGHLASLPSVYRTLPWQMVVNIAADMAVNRTVSERFFSGNHPLLKRLYRKDRFPECLLLPPTAFGVSPSVNLDDDTRDRVYRELRKKIKIMGLSSSQQRSVCEVYRAGWLEEVPFDRLIGLVANLMRIGNVDLFSKMIFLGNHDPLADRIEELPELFRDTESEMGGYSEEVEEDELDEDVEPSVSPTLAMLIRIALEEDPNHPRHQPMIEARTSVLFSPARSDWLLLSSGHWPALFHGPVFGPAYNELRVHLYIDVSGSLEKWIGWIYGLVLALGEEIGSPIHLFSNKVMDITIDDLSKGKIYTTSGTDFDCVIAHALEHRYRRIVVITDGLGELSPANAEAFRASGASLYVIIIGVRIELAKEFCPLIPLARGVWEME